MVVHESYLQRLQDDITSLKQGLFPDANPNELELHAQEIWNSNGLCRSDKYALTLEDKLQIFDRVVDHIYHFDVDMINVVIDKSLDNGMRGRHWPLERSWIDMVKAFKRYLSPQNRVEYGLIIADSSERVSEQLIAKTVYKTARRYGTGQKRSPVLDGMFFRDSRLEPVIQLADMVGYMTHKYMKEDQAFSGWYDRLGPRVQCL